MHSGQPPFCSDPRGIDGYIDVRRGGAQRRCAKTLLRRHGNLWEWRPRLLASPEELPAVLEKIPACGILLEVITSIKASPQAKKRYRSWQIFIPLANSSWRERRY